MARQKKFLAPKLTKPVMIRQLAEQTGLTQREVSILLEAQLELIQSTIAQGGEVMLSGFGSFELHSRQARRGINPNTGETVQVPATKTPHFKAGSHFKQRVNK